MKSLLPHLCLCFAVAVSADMVNTLGQDFRLEGAWGDAVKKHIPTAETFSASLSQKRGIRPEIATSFNLTAEIEHWQSDPQNPNYLQFTGDDGHPSFGTISAHQPVPFFHPLTATHLTEGVRFHYFPKYDETDMEGETITPGNLGLQKSAWDSKLPLKIIIHGFTNTIKSPVIQMIKNAYLKTGKFNVIGVDWGTLCAAPWYPGARSNVVVAGAKVGELVDALLDAKMTDPSLVHIIGHSLGAHVAGIAGKSMVKGVPKRITGLDPAGPLFQLTEHDGIIYHTDADLVDVIHTNAGYLGKSAALGDIDFYVNGGHWQANCGIDYTGSCSHARSYELFTQTILANQGIEGHLCHHLPSKADGCLKEKTIFHAYMGHPIKFEREGTYYVEEKKPSV